MSHVTHLNEPCHTYEWAMSHMWKSHVSHVNESCRTYEWVMSHVWMTHVTRMNESCHTYEWVMSHIWMIHETQTRTWLSHVTHLIESWYTSEWLMKHFWTRACRYALICSTCFIYVCAVTCAYVCRDLSMCVTRTHLYLWKWLVHACGNGSSICVTRMFSYMWRDSFVRVPWVTHAREITRAFVCDDLFICVMQLIHTCDQKVRNINACTSSQCNALQQAATCLFHTYCNTLQPIAKYAL